MNEIKVNDNNTVMSVYRKSDNILGDIENIIETSQQQAFRTVNNILTQRNWFIGYRISEELIGEQERTDYYGTEIIKKLSKELTEKYGKGYDRSNLYNCLRFYKMFPKIVDLASRQSYIQLSWTHYRLLTHVNDDKAREWYCKEAYEQTWAVKTLKRNIDTQYYYRMLKSQHPGVVKKDMEERTSTYQNDKLEFIKNPIIAEFLGMESNIDFTETELESYFISNIQKFIMELGKGYAFVGRQQHIRTEKEDYFIDLVFYNYILKCFVLVDLKTGKITHQDVGQMDMYIRMYDELKRGEGDNPTLGVVLCSETDEDIARYSVMHGSEQLFASKYKLYLPTEEELKAEIEMQKAMFELQHSDSMNALKEKQE
ncbi:PDDEXK nuclease domain-containing protein [Longibaculum muris]|uniref:PDDEXK nuclease domain-containing protein n=1 Tax=Longibaculum muris TaxID=1796628 RepID=UPI003AB726F5